MFTGLVTAIGTLTSVDTEQGNTHIRVAASGFACPVGASIAVSGICLTATASDAEGFSATLSPETLARTVAHYWQAGERVNLEASLKLGDALDGHLVSGHVDGVAILTALADEGVSRRMEFSAQPALMRFIAQKGSVTLDGVSLTVNDVGADRFTVMVIPHTAEVTTLGQISVGDTVNIEVDMLARYVARLMEAA